MQQYQKSFLYTSIILAFLSSAYAEESEGIELDAVVVKAQSFSQQIGTQKITAEQIKRQAGKDGGITDLLKSNPSVRFSNNADLSTNAGEIRPNEVSFHGQKFYGNNFILNGMSNNDNINPSGNVERNGEPVGTNPYDLPNGNTQSMWIDSSMLQDVEVFDSNVSAEHGQFLGGVVNANLKDPDFDHENTGKIYYRTTRDTWTHFYIEEGKEDEFERAARLDRQPKFVKQTHGLNISQKLADNFSLRFSYERKQSKMDNNHSQMYYTARPGVPVPIKQKRLNETYIFRGVYLPENGDLLRATLMYSPHTSVLARSNTMNGRYKSVGGGLQANLEWEKKFEALKMTSYLGYKQSGDMIDYDEENYHRYMSSSNLDWTSNGTYSQYGGYGDVYTEDRTITLKQKYELMPLGFSNIEHKVKFGWETDFSSKKYEREGTNMLNFYKKDVNVVCDSAGDCITGDQFVYQRQVFNARNVKVTDDTYSAYVEDAIKWKNLELTLGLRLDHNKFTGNTNLAHRISGSYDLFSNEDTILFGGLNRYYGRSLLAYKLRQQIGTSIEEERDINADGSLSDWTFKRDLDNVPTRYKMAKVKTPYNDEIVLGFNQRLYNTKWTFKWVNRNTRDEYSGEDRIVDGKAYRVLTNNGWSKNDSFTLTFSPVKAYDLGFMKLSWDAGWRVSRNKTNNKWYDSTANLNEKAIYNSQLIHKSDLPPEDFNTPWSAFLNLNTEFPKINLTWDQRFSYTHGKKQRVVDTKMLCNGRYSADPVCGDYVGNAEVYEDLEMGSIFNVDWRFTYTQPTFKGQFFEFTLDVNNVLNKKALSRAKKTSTSYKQGRNFWLGASYNW